MAQRAEPAPTLLETLARAPAAAALVVRALERPEDRKALRLAHPQLRDAVGEATTTLALCVTAATRPPTPACWPRLKILVLIEPGLAAIEALGSGNWGSLRELWLQRYPYTPQPCVAEALAAALRRMPALRALDLRHMCGDEHLPTASTAEVLHASIVSPRLRSLTIIGADLPPAATRTLAATGWPLEELNLSSSYRLYAASLAALAAAPSFALRRLSLQSCSLDAAALVVLAHAPWPLEELDLSCNDFNAAAAGPALGALSRHAGLRRLHLTGRLSAAGFKAVVEAAWPALTHLSAGWARVAFNGPHALGTAAFAGFPALQELRLSGVALGKVGARLLKSRRWPRLKVLCLREAQLGDAGVAALARGAWPALEVLNLWGNGLSAPPTLPAVRRWAPALVELHK